MTDGTPTVTPIPVRRASVTLRPNPARVVTKLFLPGQEQSAHAVSRADAVIDRVLAMPEDEVARTLARTMAEFAGRHRNLRATFLDHFELVSHRIPDPSAVPPDHRELIGAYFTQEFSVESAALFNPSLISHPDQRGLADGELRFIMSVRAVGEGHISSIEFRTGILGAAGTVAIEDPEPYLTTGNSGPASMSRAFLRDSLAERTDATRAEHILGLLPEHFDAADLDRALTEGAGQLLTRSSEIALVPEIRWIASCNYRLSFAPDHPLSGRVIMPSSPDEHNGIEDARFTRFIGADGCVRYYATYTAFDGVDIAPHLLETTDFCHFDSRRLIGPAAKNKGMALFPRLIDRKFWALSRWDRESIGVANSPDALSWGSATTIQVPHQTWELIQLGNCGPPIETDRGWLILTHGVGPMRAYGIGAALLDLDDPRKLIATLDDPILTPDPDERDGYVPNVVYSCGGLVHGTNLVIPYGCSDSTVRIAFLELGPLLQRLLS